jgi:hypothetical protein
VSGEINGCVVLIPVHGFRSIKNKGSMILALIVRVLLIVLIIRWIMSLFKPGGRKPPAVHDESGANTPQRFDPQGGKIDEGDYKDIS